MSVRQRFWLLCILALISLQLLLLRKAYLEHTTSANQSVFQLPEATLQFIEHSSEYPDKYFQYNRQLSDKLPLVRELPVTRHDSCNIRRYSVPHATRSKLSVVISFHNEARSILLRTILSLISRTPSSYLHELILIDDGSDDVELLESLRGLLAGLGGQPTLLFRRNLQRRGLIWSRNEGARLATGHYLLFLDSHCELNVGWLEPLLERLALNPRLAVSPLLDPIDPQTLSYLAGNALLKGGFDWSLHFHWLPRSLRDEESPAQPFKSPTFAGGIMMISREWFHQLRGFNPQLQIWGGESIEFAIKLWLCGGQIEIVPCSRIGHIFRPRHAFDFPQLELQLELELELELKPEQQQLDSAQATYLRNSKIIAESWLDEYKYLFYTLKPLAKQIPWNPLELHMNKELALWRRARQCQSFSWYMGQVYPELKIRYAKYSAMGSLRNADRCLHVLTDDQEQPQLRLVSCYQLDLSQWQLERDTGQLSSRSSSNYCLGAKLDDAGIPQLQLEDCGHAPQRWRRHQTQLLHAQTQLCLDNPVQDQLALSRCRPNAASQSFQFALEMEAQG